MSRLAIMHGKTNDEIKRNKDKAKGTMKLLGDTKKVQSNNSTTSPERGSKGGATQTGGGTTSNFMSEEENPINMLLFGNKLNKSSTMMSGMMSQSLGGTMSSNNNYMNVIIPLKYMLKHCEFTEFDIASQNEQEKKPINAEEDNTKANDGLSTKIKKLLDQRKPPTESLPRLCE